MTTSSKQWNDWQHAWTEGRRAVHLGDVGDFDAQFGVPGPELMQLSRHYSCLAAFYTPDPALLVLPLAVDPAWTDWLTRALQWGPVEVHSGIAPDTGLAEALEARPRLRERITDSGLPVRNWGGTGPVVRRFESKEESHRLFRRLAEDHPRIRVADQWQPKSWEHLTALLRDRAAAGLTSVVKARYGVAGFGTTVLTPDQLNDAVAARTVLRALRSKTPREVPLLEDFVVGHGPLRDLSFDGLVAPDGEVLPVGASVMHLEGTGYQGCTVGPDALPAPLAATATAFGLAVGRALAQEGHRGWYDVDFVADPLGRLAPTETNLRLTGPAVAFVLAARLTALAGVGVEAADGSRNGVGFRYVRTLDQLPLGAQTAQAALLDHLSAVADRCADLGVGLLPTIPTAGLQSQPFAGVALWADRVELLDAAERSVRAAVLALAGSPSRTVVPTHISALPCRRLSR